jgi:hypothetical protein
MRSRAAGEGTPEGAEQERRVPAWGEEIGSLSEGSGCTPTSTPVEDRNGCDVPSRIDTHATTPIISARSQAMTPTDAMIVPNAIIPTPRIDTCPALGRPGITIEADATDARR